jgi:hypothetical protein
MKSKAVIQIVAVAIVLSLCASDARTQERSSQNDPHASSPPPLLSPLASEENGNEPNALQPLSPTNGLLLNNEPQSVDSVQLQPDTRALSGAQNFGLGSFGGAHGVLDPALFLSEYGDTITGNSVQLVSNIALNVDFSRSWKHFRTGAFYNGQDNFGLTPASKAYQNTWYQHITVDQGIQWGRWVILVSNVLTVSPQAAFGGEATGGPGRLPLSEPEGGTVGTTAAGFAPAETILTGQSMRLDNASLAEIDYSLSRRSEITASGSYGLLDFNGPGFISSQQAVGQIGYDYSLSAANTIGFIGGYGRFSFAGTNTATEYDMIQMAFGRKISGRLAFQARAGANQVYQSNFVPGSDVGWTWNASSNLTFELPRTSYLVSYSHGLTSGSGVFFGATSDVFAASILRRVTQFWSAWGSVGYTLNNSLIPVVGASRFSGWYAGASLTRRVGRRSGVAFSYGIQKQLPNSAVCPVTDCGPTRTWQTFSATYYFAWHPRPIIVER